MNIAQTIWAQISVNTKMACGARDAVAASNKIHFTVLRGPSTKIQVTLDPSDTYTVEFIKIRKFTMTVVESQSDVYAEDLSEVIYHMCNK